MNELNALRRPILELSKEELRAWCEEVGEKPYRAKQIRHWIFARRELRFSAMTDLPEGFRQRLSDAFIVTQSTVAVNRVDDDGSRKLLLRWPDEHEIETVLIPAEDRRTICLSTQVGCAMGCVFCASGLDGVARNLTKGEMLEQFLRLRATLPMDERLTHVVVMGMGEPLANLDPLVDALDEATASDGLAISGRRVTISTVGLPSKIRRLAEWQRPYHLAVSLHAPTDELRQTIVPTAERVRLAEILAAADDYRRITGRQVTFEYVLLAGINDAPEHAARLAALIRPRDAMINLIPYNPVLDLGYRTPDENMVQRFADILRRESIVVKIRKRKGSGIDAACGQLRRRSSASSPANIVQAIPLSTG